MNSIDMIILNGVRSQARYTYDHAGREARSIVDYIAVRESMIDKVSEIKYVDCRERLQTDHILISVHVQHDNTDHTANSQEKKKT